MSRQPNLFYHETVPVAARVATAVGLTMAGFIAGQSACTSYQAIPAIMEAPAPLLARQWKKLYDIGFRIGPTAYIGNSVIIGWLASRGKYAAAKQWQLILPDMANGSHDAEPISSSAFKLYVTTALLMASAIPYSIIFIKPLNEKLKQRVTSLTHASLTDAGVESGMSKEETTHALVDKWATLNFGRAVISTTGALCAIYAALSKIDVREFSAIGLGSGANRLG
ncbi:MAG: hypothetical protein M1821_007534 [Bathelium mastoideum]|nr:MAG: hypothetical protein M1821_007534 [Bathelium mastoideum]KAI9695037.1 MAG: hypothetical protein M1822_000654 [Bathelium mastoideum]